MSKSDDIIRGSQQRASGSGRGKKVLKDIERSRDYVQAKDALSNQNLGLDKQAKKELKHLAKESRKGMSSVEKRPARDTLAMMRGSRERENPRESWCFVATAVYGGENSSQTDELRRYRDEVLGRSMIGRKFIDFYYGGFGEKAAYFMLNKIPGVIPLIRRGLDLLVAGVKYSRR